MMKNSDGKRKLNSQTNQHRKDEAFILYVRVVRQFVVGGRSKMNISKRSWVEFNGRGTKEVAKDMLNGNAEKKTETLGANPLIILLQIYLYILVLYYLI